MSLQFNVAQLLKADVGQTREYDFEADGALDLDDSVATDAHGRVKFTLTNFGILAAGRADAMLRLTCARCLEPFDSATHIEFEDEYQSAIDIHTGLPSTTPRLDSAFVINQSHTIDLSEALRQNLVLAVDLIPVCSPDCKGLCPTCGVNRNTHTCECHETEASSPFAALQGLLEEH